jgi:hypothetical protein
MYFESDNHHNNVYLILLSIGANVLSYFTQANLAIVAQLIAIIGGLMAITNYTIIFYEKYKKRKK